MLDLNLLEFLTQVSRTINETDFYVFRKLFNELIFVQFCTILAKDLLNEPFLIEFIVFDFVLELRKVCKMHVGVIDLILEAGIGFEHLILVKDSLRFKISICIVR